MNRIAHRIVAGLALLTATTTAAMSDTVELRAIDGSFAVNGELVSVRGGKYTLKTDIGVVSFEVDGFICSGTACPVLNAGSADLSVAGPAELADVALPLLAEGYAGEVEMEAQVLSIDGAPLDDQRGFEKTNEDDKSPYGRFDIRFTQDDSDAQSDILVQEATGKRLFDLLLSKQVQVIISEQKLTPEQIAAARQNGIGLLNSLDQERVIAVDGFTAIVNKKNAIKHLTIAQVSAIMSGEITNWEQLGGPKQPIKVYSLSKEMEAFHNVESLILTNVGKTLTSRASIVRSYRELSRSVNQDPNGFGLVNYSAVRGAKALAIENECGMIIQPDTFSMKAEEYPLQNRVTVYSAADLDTFGGSFVKYLDNPAVDDLIAKAGFVSLSVNKESKQNRLVRLNQAMKTADPDAPSGLLRDFVSDMLETSRLSTTFRFSPRSSVLDNKSKRDIRRILEYIRDEKPQRIILAGFADSNGAFEGNQTLSAARASEVRTELAKLAGAAGFGNTEVIARGFGELSPVACNENQIGRGVNRRVEVWSE